MTKKDTSKKLLKWSREESGNLALFVTNDDGQYVHYTLSSHYQPDYLTPANSLELSRGYRTIQRCLSLGFVYDQEVAPEETDKTAAQRVADQIVNTKTE